MQSRYDQSYPFERTEAPLSTGRIPAFYRMPNGALHCEPTTGPVEFTHDEWTEYCERTVRKVTALVG